MLGLLLCLIVMSACGDENFWEFKNSSPSKKPIEEEVFVSDITINPEGNVSVEVGKTTLLTASVIPSNATNTDVTWSSINTSIATVDAQSGVVTGLNAGTATIRATAVDGSGVSADKSVTVSQVISDDINGVVINDIRWATRNVDAPGTFAAKPEDAGMFYQWNRKVGWSTTNPLINSNGGSTWDRNTPTGDTWEKVNDPSPVGWHVPTIQEIRKLLDTDNVSNELAQQNGINGIKFTDKATGNTLFLPAAGYRNNFDGTLYDVGASGFYWSSMQLDSDDAYFLRFDSGSAVWCSYNSYYRGSGLSVRVVAE